jgi:hypothetical protein
MNPAAPATKPTPFRVDSSSENTYYNSKDLQEYDPVFYYGCKTKPRKIIAKKNIPVADYLFANLKKGEWNISSHDCKKSQLLISRAWVDANMKSMLELESRAEQHEPAEQNLLFFQYKINDLQNELNHIKLEHELAIQKEQHEKQFLQFQLDNAIHFAALKDEKYVLQIQLLQQNK